jgi:hypothetical protein
MTKARNIADIASDGSPLADGVINYGDITGLPTLGTVASTAATAYATAGQGTLADSATQPGDLHTVATTGSFTDLINQPAPFNPATLATVATTGAYSDLTGKPTLGTAAATNTTAYATAAQGTLADTATQPGDLATVATTGAYGDLSGTPAAALPLAGGAMTGAITTTSTFDGRDVSVDGTKLDGIEAGADVSVAVGSTLPAVAAAGRLFLLTTTNNLYVSTGLVWTLVYDAPPISTGGTVVIPEINEGVAFSYNLGLNFTDLLDTDSQLTYTLDSGTLPSGCVLPTAGNTAFTGTASTVSSNTSYSWVIRATDTANKYVTQNYQQVIKDIAPIVTGGTVSISNTSEGAAASYDVDTDFTYPAGITFSAYSLLSGALPSGLSLNASTGVISGTAGNDASFSFTIRGTATDGAYADQAYTWVIANVVPTSTGGTVTITAVNEGSSASYDVDSNFTFSVGSVFSAYSLQSGSLPSGLSLNTSTGVISGTMSIISSTTAYSFTIRGTDTDGDTVDQSYSWTITNVLPTSTGGTVTIAGVNGGTSISYDVDVNFTFNTGSTFSAYSLVSGALPSGTSLNTSTGVISGTVNNSTATYTFTIRATDTNGDTVDQSYSWSSTFLAPVGESVYTTGGTYTWVCPASVYSVCIVCVGAGGTAGYGSGGGALGYINNRATTPGSSYTIRVGPGPNSGNRTQGDTYTNIGTQLKANGGAAVSSGTGAPGSPSGHQGGGTGGGPGVSGGGGAAGYSGTGGYGGNGAGSNGGTGAGGGGGGGGSNSGYQGGGGGGVGLYGQGSNGGGGNTGGSGGGGGSGGTSGGSANGGAGGLYGGAAGGTGGTRQGGRGAIRIIWGPSRSFPSNAT